MWGIVLLKLDGSSGSDQTFVNYSILQGVWLACKNTSCVWKEFILTTEERAKINEKKSFAVTKKGIRNGEQTAVTSIVNDKTPFRAVFKWLSKVITWLRLLRLMIGLKDSRQFFSQWEAKLKPIAPCMRDFSRA